jgi:5-carboxymethyl-2-hydroxymuconate isomerase
VPHIVIEYSRDERFDVNQVMAALYESAASTGVMLAEDIKVRGTAFDDYLLAGVRNSFCHVSVYMLEGRTPERKVAVSEALRATLAELLPETHSISIDIRDMDAVAYKKRLLN